MVGPEVVKPGDALSVRYWAFHGDRRILFHWQSAEGRDLGPAAESDGASAAGSVEVLVPRFDGGMYYLVGSQAGSPNPRVAVEVDGPVQAASAPPSRPSAPPSEASDDGLVLELAGPATSAPAPQAQPVTAASGGSRAVAPLPTAPAGVPLKVAGAEQPVTTPATQGTGNLPAQASGRWADDLASGFSTPGRGPIRGATASAASGRADMSEPTAAGLALLAVAGVGGGAALLVGRRRRLAPMPAHTTGQS